MIKTLMIPGTDAQGIDTKHSAGRYAGKGVDAIQKI
jgi:hypothetical protein